MSIAELPADGETLLVERDGLRSHPSLTCDQTQIAERHGNTLSVAELPADGETLLV